MHYCREKMDDLYFLGDAMTKSGEHQVYVCSQTMTCICYEILKRYEAAYWLAKKLVTGSLTEKEKKQTQGFRGSQRNHQKEASRSIPLGCVCDVGLMEMVTFLPLLS